MEKFFFYFLLIPIFLSKKYTKASKNKQINWKIYLTEKYLKIFKFPLKIKFLFRPLPQFSNYTPVNILELLSLIFCKNSIFKNSGIFWEFVRKWGIFGREWKVFLLLFSFFLNYWFFPAIESLALRSEKERDGDWRRDAEKREELEIGWKQQTGMALEAILEGWARKIRFQIIRLIFQKFMLI